MTDKPTMVPLDFEELPVEQMKANARSFFETARRRRSVRDFAARDVPREIIEDAIRAAGTAPSGANMQPWHFAVVGSAEVKRRIREAAEREERAFYEERAPEDWLDAIAPLGTDASKPFLETAPWLIAVFQKRFGTDESGQKIKHYYTTESVGLATGLLIASLHRAGLATLTHTPSPMGFLTRELDRPASERPFVLLVVGYPAADAMVPDIQRHTLEEITSFH